MGDNPIHYPATSAGCLRFNRSFPGYLKTVKMPEDVRDRGRRAAAHRGPEDRDQGSRHLPGQLQGRPAALDDQEGELRSLKAATPRRPARRPRPGPARPRHASPSSRRHWCTSSSGPSSPVVVGAVRERLPRKRNSKTFSFRVADCEGYVTVGEYEDGRPGEVFIKVSKQGSTLAGIMDAFSISISLGLQHGVPLATFVRKFANMKFEPAGITDDPELRIATSLIDYIFRRLALDFLSVEERADLGILSTQERTQPTLPGVEEMATPSVGLVEDGLSEGVVAGTGPADPAQQADGPGRSSSTRRSATTAATPCSGPARATSAGAAGRPAGARENSR